MFMAAVLTPTASSLAMATDQNRAQLKGPECVSVLLRTMAPFSKSLCLRLPTSTTGKEILQGVATQLSLDASSSSILRLYTRSGRSLFPAMSLADVLCDMGTTQVSHIDLEIRLCVLGGKGGFGSMLRAQGGKMSARKGEENTDACRDLNGRRLKTVKEARSLAAYLAAAPEREAAFSKLQAEKYAKLERMLGRKPRTASDFEEAAGRLDDAGGDLEHGAEGSNVAEKDVVVRTRNLFPVRGREAASSGFSGRDGVKRGVAQQQQDGRRELVEDHQFLQESREAVEKAKGAVATAMAKQKQKQKQKQKKSQEHAKTATSMSTV